MRSALSGSIGMSAITTSEVAVARRPTRMRAWLWLLAPLAVALLFAIAPVRNLLLPARTGVAIGAAHGDYLKAQDLLDHYYKPDNIKNAVALFQKTVAEDPKFALAYAGLGRAHFLRYRDTRDATLIDQTQTNCSQALALDRELASVHVTLGMLYTETTRNDLAAQELQQALRLDSKNAEGNG